MTFQKRENHPRWVGNDVKKTCPICNKSFYVRPCRVKIRKHCSKECMAEGYKRIDETKHPRWKGDKADKPAIHVWIRKHLGTPKECWECGSNNLPSHYYQLANISGKYLRDIKDWKRLCAKCHWNFDKHLHPRGETAGLTKLTDKKVIKIRKLYIPQKYGIYILSKRFSVAPCTIYNIIKRKTWKHI